MSGASTEHLATLLRAEEQQAKDKAWFTVALAGAVLTAWLVLWVSL